MSFQKCLKTLDFSLPPVFVHLGSVGQLTRRSAGQITLCKLWADQHGICTEAESTKREEQEDEKTTLGFLVISFLCLSNLSHPCLKTKESSILECWRRFKNVVFLRLTYHVILVQHTPQEPMRFCQRGLLNEIRRPFVNFFQITILLFNRQSFYKNEFLEVSKNSGFLFLN